LDPRVNSIAGLLILVFDGARNVVERSNEALLAAPCGGRWCLPRNENRPHSLRRPRVRVLPDT